jgi:hypothetical protein
MLAFFVECVVGLIVMLILYKAISHFIDHDKEH